MSKLFLSVVNTSILAGYLVLVVLILRLLLKRAPKRITILLWGIVAVRLVGQFNIQSSLCLFPKEVISTEISMGQEPLVDTGFTALDNIINPAIHSSLSADQAGGISTLQTVVSVLAVVWLAGIAVFFVYTAISFLRIRKNISTAVLVRDNIFQSENVRSPFVFGLVRPRIYLPLHLNEADMSSVIAHEQAHIKCRDYIIKPVGYLLLMVHWFNPLIWLSYMLFCKDIELACDERVIRKYTPKQRADYSQALLNCSTDKHSAMVYPLSFGEVGVKSRVKSVLNYKKPTFWIGVAAIVAIVVMALCFLTSPKFKREETAIVEDYAGDYVVMQYYYELDDGRWACGDYTYTYRLVLTGSIKSNTASTSITYIVLSNTQDITFEQAHKASGLSSNIDDYFDPETAVIVAHIYDDK